METNDSPETEAVTKPTETNSSGKRPSCLLVGLLILVLVLAVIFGGYLWYNRPIKPVELSQQEVQIVEEKVEVIESDPVYEKGSKDIVFTEREMNGLIHQNTDFGDKISLALAKDEVHARVEVDLAEDLPVLGGKRLKARARFLVKMTETRPSLVLDDLTLWGISLPNEWLFGLKGTDLLSFIFGESGGLAGVEELRIERGQIVIRLAE
ncbi:MAG: hypothetical protein AB8D78_12065 [Akkermansiaceae bacterium]